MRMRHTVVVCVCVFLKTRICACVHGRVHVCVHVCARACVCVTLARRWGGEESVCEQRSVLLQISSLYYRHQPPA